MSHLERELVPYISLYGPPHTIFSDKFYKIDQPPRTRTWYGLTQMVDPSECSFIVQSQHSGSSKNAHHYIYASDAVTQTGHATDPIARIALPCRVGIIEEFKAQFSYLPLHNSPDIQTINLLLLQPELFRINRIDYQQYYF
jgi:hypothetical protein